VLRHSSVVRSVAVLPATGGERELAVPAGVDLAHAAVVGLLQDSRTMKIFAADRAAVVGVTDGRINGRVTDDGGRGLGGITVQACSGSVCVPAVSGSDGSFAFTELSPGTWSHAAGPGGQPVQVVLRPGEEVMAGSLVLP
jgi:hypothetical protein